MGRAALIFGLMIVASASVLAYRAYSRHRDLIETIAWMEQTYNPHEGGENWGRGHGDETHYVSATRTPSCKDSRRNAMLRHDQALKEGLDEVAKAGFRAVR